MKLLLDTHLLLRAAAEDIGSVRSLPVEAAILIDDPDNELIFSAASIWEITIKNNLGRADFRADPYLLRRGLLDNGYIHLPIDSAHALAVGNLPNHHKDPFDRILIAQAAVEGITLVTSDPLIAIYPGPIRKV
jgi:PIN domain nuclease of toxin-antitoxin system